MVRYAFSLRDWNFIRNDGKAIVHLHGVGIDNLAIESSCYFNGKLRQGLV